MSKILKGIGKVFKKVVKVAKIVVPIALAAAAVVFTGGAALGLLPTFSAAVGGVAASLGLGTALTGALTGAVVGAGFGSAIGGLTSGLSGGSIIKGMQKGALTGALTGGITGAVSPSTFGIVKGLDSAGNTVTTTMNALKNGGNAFAAAGSKTALTTGADGITRVADSVAPSAAKVTSVSKELAQGIGTRVTDSAGTAAVTQAGSGASAGGGLLGNPQLVSQLLGGVAQAFAPSEASEAAKAKIKTETGLAWFAYGGGDPDGKKKGFGHIPGVYSAASNPFGTHAYAPPPPVRSAAYALPAPRYAWDPATSTVVERRA